MGAGMELSDRIGRRLKLQDLHVLMAVVQAGSMSKAAALLNTGQSAISRSIGELERTLGVYLLERGPRGVEPTQYGRALLDGGAAVFDDLRQTVRNIEFLSDPATGEVWVGCNSSVAASFVSAVVDRLSRRYPRIVVQLVMVQLGKKADSLRDLHERKLDLVIIRRFGALADERLSFEFLFDDPFVVAAGAQSPWTRRRKIELAELVRRAGRELGYDVAIKQCVNPRVEAENHYYNAVNRKLLELGLKPHYLGDELVQSLLSIISRHRERVITRAIEPSVRWHPGEVSTGAETMVPEPGITSG